MGIVKLSGLGFGRSQDGRVFVADDDAVALQLGAKEAAGSVIAFADPRCSGNAQIFETEGVARRHGMSLLTPAALSYGTNEEHVNG